MASFQHCLAASENYLSSLQQEVGQGPSNAHHRQTTMPSPPHLQIFNPDSSARDVESHFHLFPRLPTEIRLQIWEYVLPSLARPEQRILKIELSGSPEQWETGFEDDVDHDGEIGRYCVYASRYQVMNKFLFVNRETREMVLDFYRVQIPCRFSVERAPINGLYSTQTKPGTLYFNPEYDFLHISIRRLSSRQGTIRHTYLQDFLQDLKTTYDPHHVGLLNLAVGIDDIMHMMPSDADVFDKPAFLETIEQLQEIFFLHQQRYGRTNFGRAAGVDRNEFFFARSMPIMPLAPSFERLARDPRPIGQDLTRVSLAVTDGRDGPAAWRRLLQKWGVPEGAGTKYTYLLAFCNQFGRDVVHSRESAARWLETEYEEHWQAQGRRKYKLDWPAEDVEKAVASAFGFWLFPLEAFGPFAADGQPAYHNRPGSVLDVSAHWPELALSPLL